jgi:hypothetical protein
MKTGIELIAQERKEQIEKHGRSTGDDVRFNNKGQLQRAAEILITIDEDIDLYRHKLFIPSGWNKDIWFKMLNKPHKERLIIAGVLIAAEIDRLQASTNEKE